MNLNQANHGLAFGHGLWYNDHEGSDLMSKFVIRPDVDLVAMLKEAGYSTYRISNSTKANGKTPLFGSAAMTKFRKRGMPSWGELAKLVHLLHVSPVDLIAYQSDDGTLLDLNGKRISTPSPQPTTYVQHGHPGDDGYDPDDPGDQMPCDDDY